MEKNRDTKELLKPIFMKKEIVVPMPNNSASFGDVVQECRATVLYVGSNQEYYNVGDDILFDRNIGRKITFFEEDLWKIDSELSVICKLEKA